MTVFSLSNTHMIAKSDVVSQVVKQQRHVKSFRTLRVCQVIGFYVNSNILYLVVWFFSK